MTSFSPASTALVNLAALPLSIPSPPVNSWHLGPLTIRAYGIAIALGMVAAVLITQRRYQRRGGDRDLVVEVALWAIPCGIVGARIYHVITSPEAYFGPHGHLIDTLKIWNGGIGIWGAIFGGVLGGWIALRRQHQRLGPFLDAVAPALLVAQAIGRFGNWFNQELFGAPTTLPWGLEIYPPHLPAAYQPGTLFHPTFLYEVIWNLLMATVIIILDRRIRFSSGQVMFLYIMAYTLGRVWIEMLRIDTANTFLGQRLNVWVMSATFILGGIGFYLAGKRAASTRVEMPEQHGGDEE